MAEVEAKWLGTLFRKMAGPYPLGRRRRAVLPIPGGC